MRLERELKEAGDAALAELGLTPSTAVRGLWEQAARRGKGIESIATLLLGEEEHLRLLVCTDVWVALLDKRPRVEAQAMLRDAQSTHAELLYPATALKDVYAALGGQEGKKGAWRAVDRMRELGTAVGVDEADLTAACRYRALTGSLEENITLAAAERAQADYLVTFDESLLLRSTVAALSPKDMCTVLEARA